jgi:hypothetical protein
MPSTCKVSTAPQCEKRRQWHFTSVCHQRHQAAAFIISQHAKIMHAREWSISEHSEGNEAWQRDIQGEKSQSGKRCRKQNCSPHVHVWAAWGLQMVTSNSAGWGSMAPAFLPGHSPDHHPTHHHHGYHLVADVSLMVSAQEYPRSHARMQPLIRVFVAGLCLVAFRCACYLSTSGV